MKRNILFNMLGKQDVHFISYPKSGRSWIRFILLQLKLEKNIRFHHDGFEFNDAKCPSHNFSIERRLKKYTKVDKIIYLERDPRDVMISLYHQVTGRFEDFFNYQGSLSEFIRDDYFGAHTLRDFREMWRVLEDRLGVLRITYEECHDDTEELINRIIHYMGKNISGELIREASSKASFSQMSRLEKSGEFHEPWLNLRNSSPKVRKGKVGGFVEIMSEDDIEYLSKIFGLCRL